jgi:hypothetical protein
MGVCAVALAPIGYYFEPGGSVQSENVQVQRDETCQSKGGSGVRTRCVHESLSGIVRTMMWPGWAAHQLSGNWQRIS